jgi:single stranded DNA-binding protein
MITTAEIEVIGYVGKNPIVPKSQEYPNFVTFPVGVSRTWKDKEGKEQKVTTWFDCNTNSENIAKVIKAYVTQGMGVLIKGYPKIKTYIDKSGNAKGSIEINISYMNLLTGNKEKVSNSNSSEETLAELSTFNESIPF